MDTLITQKEASEVIGVTEALLRQWRYNGVENVPSVKVGRRYKYSLKELQTWIKSKEVK